MINSIGGLWGTDRNEAQYNITAINPVMLSFCSPVLETSIQLKAVVYDAVDFYALDSVEILIFFFFIYILGTLIEHLIV